MPALCTDRANTVSMSPHFQNYSLLFCFFIIPMLYNSYASTSLVLFILHKFKDLRELFITLKIYF